MNHNRFLICCFVLTTAGLQTDLSAADQPQRITIDRAVQALEIARLAAENDMVDLSLRAFRDALAAGPPVFVRRIMERPSTQRSVVPLTTIQLINANNTFKPATPRFTFGRSATNITRETQALINPIHIVERAQRVLDRLWREHDFPPDRVFDVLADVVLPRDQPGRIYEYRAAPDKDADRQQPEESIGLRLIEWAVKADRVGELMQRLKARHDLFQAVLMHAEVGLYRRDVTTIEAALDRFHPSVHQGFRDTDHQRALSIVLRAIGLRIRSEKVLPIIDRAVDAMISEAKTARTIRMPTGQIEPLSTWLLASARLHFAGDNQAEALQAIESYLSINLAGSDRYSEKHSRQLRYHHLLTVAGVLFDARETERAINYLEQAAGLPMRYLPDSSVTTLQHLCRYLAQLSPSDRYQQLRRLCLPSEPGGWVSMLNGLLPATSPPAYVQSVDLSDLVLSPDRKDRVIGTGTLLVEAAAKVGELAALRAELAALVADDSPNAAALLAVAHLQAGDVKRALPLVEKQAERISYDRRTRQKIRDPLVDLMVCAKARRHARGTTPVTTLATEIRNYCDTVDAPRVMGTLNEFSFAAIDTAPKTNPSATALLASFPWKPARTVPIQQIEQGSGQPIWSTQDGAIARLSGSGRDSLYLPVPLTGEFSFKVEASAAKYHEAGVGYGGVFLESRGPTDTAVVTAIDGTQQGNPRIGYTRSEQLNATTISVTPTETRMAVNGRTIFVEETRGLASPWIFLTSNSAQPSHWRFPQIFGEPVIPREVHLTNDAALRGWTAVALENSRATPFPDTGSSSETTADWTWSDGVLRGRSESAPRRTIVNDAQSIHDLLFVSTSGRLLQYDRPLCSGEMVSWEFEYQPDRRHTGVAFGRMVCTIEPDGVYQRYVTSPRNWYQIPVDNSQQLTTTRPPLQRGWNQATLQYQHDQVILTLNGTEICSISNVNQHDSQFGFYYDSRRYESRVRNVVLTGNWPEKIPDSWRQGLAPNSTDDAQTRSQTVNGPFVAAVQQDIWMKNTGAIVQHAEQLAVRERDAFLRRIVLPSSSHGGFRIPPGTGRNRTPSQALKPDDLENPVYQLIDTARQLNTVSDLRNNIIEAPVPTSGDLRASYGLLALISMAENDTTTANDYLQRSVSMTQLDHVRNLASGSKQNEHWIDVLVAAKALDHPSLWKVCRDALQFGANNDSMLTRYRVHLFHQLERLIHDRQNALPDYWHAVSHSKAKTRGQGLPPAVWTTDNPGAIQHIPGYDDDHVFLQSPVIGSFSIHAQMTAEAGQTLQFGYGGVALGFVPENDRQVFLYPFGRAPRRYWQKTPPLQLDGWVDVEFRVTPTTITYLVDDRPVHTKETHHDPWIFVRSPALQSGRFRDLRISGRPVIPNAFMLDTSASLQGWTARSYGDGVGRGLSWHSDDGVIEAEIHPSAGHHLESLLQYHRPIMEDGTLSYDFYYKMDNTNDNAGNVVIHPAIGQHAWLLSANRGVLVHELTDGCYDIAGRPTDNARVEPEHQLTRNLPLVDDAWNQMKITVRRDSLTLVLNDTKIFRDTLPESKSSRIFGLFHFRDLSAGRVRNISWTGNWPKKLPHVVTDDAHSNP